jgi:glucan 1,3-beta-glucosidase
MFLSFCTLPCVQPLLIQADLSSGIPFTVQDDTPQSWHNPVTTVTHQPNQQSSSCTAAGTSSSGFWYEKIAHNGQSSFLSTDVKKNYPVFRNVVKDFGADNTGQNDTAGAIQSAIEGIAASSKI